METSSQNSFSFWEVNQAENNPNLYSNDIQDYDWSLGPTEELDLGLEQNMEDEF